MIRLFFSPAGRSRRRDFWIGFVGFVVFVFAAQYLLNATVNTMTGFWLFLIYIFLVFQILYAVYGKRLHDIGRSYWLLTAMLTLTLLLMIIVMLSFGGAEYFSEFSQYDRKEDIDPVVIQEITMAYQAKMASAEKVLKSLLYGIWGLFTIWLGLAKPDPSENRYGKPPLTS